MKAMRLCGLTALLITSCAVRPSSVPAAEPPPAWRNGGGFPSAAPSKDLTRWWSRFNDATLSKLISGALKNSPDIASATANIRQARALRKVQAAGLFPTVNGSLGASGTNTSLKHQGNSYSNQISGSLDASWEVDLFGQQRSLIDAASANLGASEENLHSVQASLSSEIAIAYVTLRSTEAQLRVVQDNVKTRQDNYDLANWRHQSGQADALEPEQALTSLEQAKASIPSLQQSIAQSHNLLAKLSGNAPGALDKLLASGKEGLPSPPSSLAIGIPADTLRQRPDLRVAGYQWLAAVATTKNAKAQRFPSLNLTGSLGLSTLSASKIFNPETATTGIIASLTGPIFDAGRIRANIEAQSAAEEQTLQTYRSTVLTALSEVEDALIACKRTQERIEALQRAAEPAVSASKLADQRYEAGTVDFTTVLEAQRTLLDIQQSIISAQADRTTAYIQLYKALGGGWAAEG